MKIQVLGSGCAKCKKLFEITQKAITEMGRDEKVEYITDISKIIEMGIMTTPVLAIDGNPVMTGFTPDIEKIKKIINSGVKTDNISSKCSCGGKC
ncbi:MAG: thioredoxin family protein [Candidatus Roizmanbacteria bacterium]|nr:thioredoxin family protein [Candidatus Roizmanbacteria bacterium]